MYIYTCYSYYSAKDSTGEHCQKYPRRYILIPDRNNLINSISVLWHSVPSNPIVYQSLKIQTLCIDMRSRDSGEPFGMFWRPRHIKNRKQIPTTAPHAFDALKGIVT